jgi:transposase-like protein
LVQKRKDIKAATLFFRLLLKVQGIELLKGVTDKLASYSAAKKEIIPNVDHSTVQYENDGCELSHSRLDNNKGRYKAQIPRTSPAFFELPWSG